MAKRKLQADPRPTPRCMLYNEHGGEIFTGEDAIQDALDDGWEDAPLPASKLAQSPTDDAEDLRAQLREMNAALESMHGDLRTATQRADNAEAKLAGETSRADAAEKKLAAAVKAKGNAGK